MQNAFQVYVKCVWTLLFSLIYTFSVIINGVRLNFGAQSHQILCLTTYELFGNFLKALKAPLSHLNSESNCQLEARSGKVKEKKNHFSYCQWRVLVREDHRQTVTRVLEQYFENTWESSFTPCVAGGGAWELAVQGKNLKRCVFIL